jgi:integrase
MRRRRFASRVLPKRDFAMRLDNRTIARLPLPEDKLKNDVIYFDQEVSGFGIRFRRNRSGDRLRRTWVAQYRAHGRTRRLKIGAVEKVSPDDARKAAKKALAKVELGGDPQGEREAKRRAAVHTLLSVATDYLDARKPDLRPASCRAAKLYLTGRAYFGPLHTTAISDIARADVAARVGAIARNSGTVTAGRARAVLSTLFAWAMGEGLCENNPVIGTNKPADSTPRDRVIEDREMAAIWRESGDDDYGKVIKLLILTGARRSEVGGLRWNEVDDKGVWTLPKERSKNGRPLALPLPQAALDIVESMPQRVDRDCLFGERAAAGFTHWSFGKAALDKRLAGKVAPWKLHDLRRSAATRLADLGVQPHVIECILNHHSGFRSGASGTYNRSPYLNEMRTALALWADHLKALIEGGGRKVLSLRKAGQ